MLSRIPLRALINREMHLSSRLISSMPGTEWLNADDQRLINEMMCGKAPNKDMLSAGKLQQLHRRMGYPISILPMAHLNLHTLLTDKSVVLPVKQSLVMLETSLAAGDTLDAKDHSGMTVASYALRSGDLESFKIIRPKIDLNRLQFGGDPFGGQPDSISLLTVAAFFGHYPMLDYLLKEGADPRLGSVSPLLAAVLAMSPWAQDSLFIERSYVKRLVAIKLLLKHGADLAATADYKELYKLYPAMRYWHDRHFDHANALHCAAAINPRLVAVLLKYGAKPDSQALIFAARAGKVQIIDKLLVASDNSLLLDKALVAAITAGHWQAFLRLKHAGAKLTVNSALLHAAAQGGNVAIINALLAAGHRVEERDHEGSTPLHRAAIADRSAAVKRLIAAGADPEAQNNQGQRPLHLAAKVAARKALCSLLQYKLISNSIDNNANTPLHLLVESMRGVYDDREVTDTLIALLAKSTPADLMLRNKAGYTPVSLLETEQQICMNWEMAFLLQAYQNEGIAALDKFKLGKRLYVESKQYNLKVTSPSLDPIVYCLQARLSVLTPPDKNWLELNAAERVRYAFCAVYKDVAKIAYYQAIAMLPLGHAAIRFIWQCLAAEHDICMKRNDFYPELYVAMAIACRLLHASQVEVNNNLAFAKALDAKRLPEIWHELIQYLPKFLSENMKLPAAYQDRPVASAFAFHRLTALANTNAPVKNV